jgi:hypothetical protein
MFQQKKIHPAVGVSVKVGALGAAVNACERCRRGLPFSSEKDVEFTHGVSLGK